MKLIIIRDDNRGVLDFKTPSGLCIGLYSSSWCHRYIDTRHKCTGYLVWSESKAHKSFYV